MNILHDVLSGVGIGASFVGSQCSNLYVSAAIWHRVWTCHCPHPCLLEVRIRLSKSPSFQMLVLIKKNCISDDFLLQTFILITVAIYLTCFLDRHFYLFGEKACWSLFNFLFLVTMLCLCVYWIGTPNTVPECADVQKFSETVDFDGWWRDMVMWIIYSYRPPAR